MPCRILIVLTLLLVAACAGSPNSPDNNTTARNTHPNRVYFCLDTTDGHIVIPVYVNDTVAATVLFDTGAAPGFILDSAFVKTHYLTPAVAPEKEDVHIPFVYEKKVLSLQYHCPMPLKIGNTVVNNSVLNVFDLSQGGLHAVDGVVTIPSEDTVHIWEVNFEKNYLEIHDSRHFQMPENCRWHPLIYMNNACLIEMPLQIIHSGDTLLIYIE